MSETNRPECIHGIGLCTGSCQREPSKELLEAQAKVDAIARQVLELQAAKASQAQWDLPGVIVRRNGEPARQWASQDESATPARADTQAREADTGRPAVIYYIEERRGPSKEGPWGPWGGDPKAAERVIGRSFTSVCLLSEQECRPTCMSIGPVKGQQEWRELRCIPYSAPATPAPVNSMGWRRNPTPLPESADCRHRWIARDGSCVDCDEPGLLPSLDTAPAGDAEVSHERALHNVLLLHTGDIAARSRLLAYISQQEARQQQAEREVAAALEELAVWRRDAVRYEKERDEAQHDALDLRATLQGKDEAIAELAERLADAKQRGDELSRKLEAAERRTLELLARIHGDGGHHVSTVGVEQACEEADMMVAEWRVGLTPDDVRSIARAVVAEVAERANGRGNCDEPALLKLVEAAKEGS